jgi:hypothetical protein
MFASLTFARAQTLPRINRDDDARPRELLSEGLGVGRVYVGHSTADDVASVYGKTFETVEHGANSPLEHGPASYEMRYSQLGLAFFYCHDDQRKRIFSIKARWPFDGFTAHGIERGKSTLRDVVKAYGEPVAKTGIGVGDPDSTYQYEYPGIRFYVAYDKPANNPDNAFLSSKVIVIEVITSKGDSACDPSNLK